MIMSPIFKKYFARLFCMLCLALPAFYALAAPTPAEWRQLKSDKTFNYKNEVESLPLPDDNGQGGFQKILMSCIHFLMGPAGTLLLWILVIGIVSYIVYWLSVSNGSFFFGRSQKKVTDNGPATPEEEDINGTNWEALLRQANHDEDTRLAVRYRYMWLLQMLQERELIRYRNDKTNYDYYTELDKTNYKLPFKQMSRLYEYAWYGNFTLSPVAYHDYAGLFDNMKNQLAR
jgi:hypothetical protein